MTYYEISEEFLADALRQADNAGLDAARQTPDVGSCNLDAVRVCWHADWGRPTPKRLEKMARAAKKAGVYCTWYNCRWFKGWVIGNGSGQAAKNTAYCEAFAKRFKEVTGLPAFVHYVTD